MAEQVKQKKPKKVLLAMDGSKHSDYAFEWYMENAHEKDDEVFMGFCAEFHHHHSNGVAKRGEMKNSEYLKDITSNCCREGVVVQRTVQEREYCTNVA